MNVASLYELLEPWVVLEQTDTYGGVVQPDRLLVVAREACHAHRGDLVEIGCQYGRTTVKLAQVAREFDRKLIAVDPYQPGTQNCEGDELGIFTATMEPYADVLQFHRLDSREPAVQGLLTGPLAFAFIDGLHTYAACCNDIANTAHAGLLVVDDVIWSAEVRRAFYEAAEYLPREPLHLSSLREGYLL